MRRNRCRRVTDCPFSYREKRNGHKQYYYTAGSCTPYTLSLSRITQEEAWRAVGAAGGSVYGRGQV